MALKDSLKKLPSEALLFENYGRLCLIVDELIFEVYTHLSPYTGAHLFDLETLSDICAVLWLGLTVFIVTFT